MPEKNIFAHMINIKKLIALVHILPWTYAAIMFSWEYLIENQPVNPRALLIGLYVFYFHLFIFQKYFNKKKYTRYFIFFVAILLTGKIPYLLFLWLQKGIGDLSMSYLLTNSYWRDATFFLFNSIIIAVIGRLIVNSIKKGELEKQAIHTELVYLKSQINPHFLFNTLNNIHTLVYMQAAEAPEAVMRLSSLMRYMIYESNATTVPLKVEIDYLQDYISLQQLRYESSPVVDFKVEGDVEACNVAPLLLIHILENAYKHSPATLAPGSIKVKLTFKENLLVASFQNPIGNKSFNLFQEPGGIGLKNVQKRLQLLYPNQHSLELNQTDKIFTTELKIRDLQKKN